MDGITATASPKHASARRGSSASVVRPTTVVLEVSSVVFRCVWISILVVRCASVLYLLASAGLYFFLAEPTMIYYASLLGSHAPPQLLPMATFLVALALAQLYRIVAMVFWSCVRGELAFEAASVNKRVHSNAVVPLEGPLASRHQIGSPVMSQQRLPWLGRVGHVWSSLWGSSGGAYMWRLLFGRQGFFSIKSEYFEIRLALREFTEILSQTLQLQKASKLLVKHWITDMYATIVVVNCWSTPVVQFHCRQKLKVVQKDLKSARNPGRSDVKGPSFLRVRSSGFERQLQGVLALERLLCVAIDVVLDLCTSMVLPAVILYPYVQKFDLSTFTFGNDILYDDVRFVSLVNEMQHVLATTPIEAVLTVFPHWGIYAGCGNVRKLLVREDQADLRHVSGSVVRVRPSMGIRVASAAKAVPMTASARALQRTSGAFLKRLPTWIRVGRTKMVSTVRNTVESNRVHLVFFLWGLALLSLHISSIVLAGIHERSRPPGCKQVLRPWLTDKTACSVFEFNCYMNKSATVTENDFDELEKEFLAVLILSHCSALVVPPSIRHFPNLLGFETYNSTIVQWSKRSSFSLVTQNRLAYLMLLKTNMSSFPEGLTTRLPANLLDIEISISNLTELPENLDKLWPPMAVLYVEYCAFSSFPGVLSRLSVADLSLVGNPIATTADVRDWSRATFWSLSLAHNPIGQLPVNPVWDLDVLRFLVLEGTAISELPVWFEATQASQLEVYLKGSSFCGLQANEGIHKRFGSGAFVTCVDEFPRGVGAVPVELISSNRLLVPHMPG